MSYASGPRRVSGTNRFGFEDRAANWDLDAVVTDGFERNVWTYKCVDWMATNQAKLPFRIGRELDGDDKEILERHPLYRVMNKRANPLEVASVFRYRLSCHLLLSKRGAFVEPTRSRAGTITRLDLLAPDRILPVPSNDGTYLDYWEYTQMDGHIRELDPSQILWIRKPHPTDPFCGTTPLEAAGISVEMDFLGRFYNVNFIKNDGRPSGILGIDVDGLDDEEMARVESRLSYGAQNAGKTAVVGTGPGGMEYVDTSTKPRDMAYSEAAANAKLEILSAFGLDESVIGAVAGRTFDNAEQAMFNAWTQPMQGHLDTIASAFDDDVDDDWNPFFDTSKVEALELPERKRRAEALNEWQAGLRSMNEYRKLAKLEPVNSAYARAMWISPAKAPVPGRPEDAAELGVGGGAGAAAAGGPAAQVVAAARAAGGHDDNDAAAAAGNPGAIGGPAAAAVAAARGENPDMAGGGAAAAAVAAARGGGPAPTTGGGSAADVVRTARMEKKTLEPGPKRAPRTRPKPDPDPPAFDPGDMLQQRTEIAAAAAIDQLLARQAGVITARLRSPKFRKDTRFWETTGDVDPTPAVLDVEKAVNADFWAEQAAATLAPIVDPAATEAGYGLLAYLLATGALADSTGDDELRGRAVAATGVVALGAVAIILEWLTEFLSRLTKHLAGLEPDAGSVEDLVTAVNDYYSGNARTFAGRAAVFLGYGVVAGAMEATAGSLAGLPNTGDGVPVLVRSWVTRDDARVRPTHREVHGKALPAPEPFVVGHSRLRYPHDPGAPLAETVGCRCRLSYAVKRGDRFVGAPRGRATV